MGDDISRRRDHQVPEDVGTLWILERMDATARCALLTCPGKWELRVIIDGMTLLAEPCERPQDAFTLAEAWKGRMLQDGWRQIVPSQFRQALGSKRRSA